MKDDKTCNHVKLGNLDLEVLGTEIKLTVQNDNEEGKLQLYKIFFKTFLMKLLYAYCMQLVLRDFLENHYQKFWECQITAKMVIFA